MAPVIFPQTFPIGKALEDGSLINAAIAQPLLSSQNGIVAWAGGGFINATQLFAAANLVTICVTNNDSVKLPSALPMVVYIKNNTANILGVFPAGTDTINNLSVQTAFSHPAGATIAYICFSVGSWFLIESAGGL